MNHDKVLNAFESVRPRGVDRPSAAPAHQAAGRAPLPLAGSLTRVLDRGGVPNATLAPRVYGAAQTAKGEVQ